MHKAILDRLTAPFDDSEIMFLPKQISNGRALVFPYLEAPPLIVRLNDVLGPLGWTWEVRALSDGSVVGRLSIFDSETDTWVSKEGVGSPNQGGFFGNNTIGVNLLEVFQSLENESQVKEMQALMNKLSRPVDEYKHAETDAFKRTARMFGIGLQLWTDWKSDWFPYNNYKISTPHEEIVARCKKGAKVVAQTEPIKVAVPKEATFTAKEADILSAFDNLIQG